MTGIIYTYPPDYVMAAMSARAMLAAGVRPVVAIDHKDPRLVIEGVEVIRTREDRGGNLNGKDFIVANLKRMLELATGPYTFKCDSDTLILSADHVAGRSETAVGVYASQMQGCCYALLVEALPAMIELAETRLKPGMRLMEDQLTGQIAKIVGPVHLPEHLREVTHYAAYKRGLTPAHFRDRGDCVVNFPLREGMDRRAVAAAMKEFL
jgi:hypothetical protein